jgi:hypothetical protein
MVITNKAISTKIVLPSPAISPDLSPIEHLWDELGRSVGHRQNPPETLQKMRDALMNEWNNIPQPLSNDWLVLCVGDAKLLLLKEVITHVTELRKPLYCMTISVLY